MREVEKERMGGIEEERGKEEEEPSSEDEEFLNTRL